MRVLIVEDSSMQRAMLADLIRQRGHEAVECRDAESAWKVYCETPFPLVLLDWMLPGISGLELCARLNKVPARALSYILALTARDQPEHLKAMLDAGADDYMSKQSIALTLGVRLTIAERRIAELLERKETHRTLLARAKQQALVAELGQKMVNGISFTLLLDEAATLIADALEVECCGLFELSADGSQLSLRAGVGCKPGAVIRTDAKSPLALALIHQEPAFLHDFSMDHAEIFGNRKLADGAAVIIAGTHWPFGTLGAFSASDRPFGDAEAAFLQSVANVLSSAIERTRSEDTLRRNERRFRALIENGNDIIVVLNLDNSVEYVSPSIERVLGYLPDAILGRRITDLIHKEDAEQAEQAILNMVQSRDQSTRVELRFCHARDGLRVLETIGRLQRNEFDQWTLCANLRDVTERKKAEADRESYTRDLESAKRQIEEQAVALRLQASELAVAKVHAEEANRAKSEFLANMSHEIRTPMTAILGYTDILIEDPNVRQYASERIPDLETVKRNAEHLLEIINDILDLSKIEAGQMSVELIRCNPTQLVSEVVSLMRVRAAAKGLPVDVEFEGPLPETIETDPTRIRQILINLIGNAIKFTETGGIQLRIRHQSRSSQGAPSNNLRKPSTSMIQFDVVDSGIGMTESQMERIFNPFIQADTSTTRRFGGTGLGLAITKRIVELLGGAVVVASSQGKGSTFSVTVATGDISNVPMIEIDSEVNIRRRQPDPVVSMLPKCRILLAEDGPDNQRLISFLLRKAGAEVTIAGDGQVACQLAFAAKDENRPFDVILMDMQMPILDGYGATRRLRASGYRHPIVALTAHAMSGDDNRCFEVGCDGYATKPIDRTVLIQTICERLEKKDSAAPAPSVTPRATE